MPENIKGSGDPRLGDIFDPGDPISQIIKSLDKIDSSINKGNNRIIPLLKGHKGIASKAYSTGGGSSGSKEEEEYLQAAVRYFSENNQYSAISSMKLEEIASNLSKYFGRIMDSWDEKLEIDKKYKEERAQGVIYEKKDRDAREKAQEKRDKLRDKQMTSSLEGIYRNTLAPILKDAFTSVFSKLNESNKQSLDIFEKNIKDYGGARVDRRQIQELMSGILKQTGRSISVDSAGEVASWLLESGVPINRGLSTMIDAGNGKQMSYAEYLARAADNGIQLDLGLLNNAGALGSPQDVVDLTSILASAQGSMSKTSYESLVALIKGSNYNSTKEMTAAVKSLAPALNNRTTQELAVIDSMINSMMSGRYSPDKMPQIAAMFGGKGSGLMKMFSSGASKSDITKEMLSLLDQGIIQQNMQRLKNNPMVFDQLGSLMGVSGQELDILMNGFRGRSKGGLNIGIAQGTERILADSESNLSGNDPSTKTLSFLEENFPQVIKPLESISKIMSDPVIGPLATYGTMLFGPSILKGIGGLVGKGAGSLLGSLGLGGSAGGIGASGVASSAGLGIGGALATGGLSIGLGMAGMDIYKGYNSQEGTMTDRVLRGLGSSAGGGKSSGMNILGGGAKYGAIGAGIGTMIAPGIGSLIGGVGGALIGSILSAIGGDRIGQWYVNFKDTIVDLFSLTTKNFGAFMNTGWEALNSLIELPIALLKRTGSEILDLVFLVKDNITEVLANIAGGIWSGVKTTGSKVAGVAGGVVDTLFGWVPGAKEVASSMKEQGKNANYSGMHSSFAKAGKGRDKAWSAHKERRKEYQDEYYGFFSKKIEKQFSGYSWLNEEERNRTKKLNKDNKRIAMSKEYGITKEQMEAQFNLANQSNDVAVADLRLAQENMKFNKDNESSKMSIMNKQAKNSDYVVQVLNKLNTLLDRVMAPNPLSNLGSVGVPGGLVGSAPKDWNNSSYLSEPSSMNNRLKSDPFGNLLDQVFKRGG